VRTYRLSLLVKVRKRPRGEPFGIAESEPFDVSQGKWVGRGLIRDAASSAA
jgi:hypothetical protein